MNESICWHLHLSSIDLDRSPILLLHMTLALGDIDHLLLQESRANQLVMLMHLLTHGLRHLTAVCDQTVMFDTSFLRRSVGFVIAL